MNYTELKTTDEFKAFMKSLYLPSTQKVEELTVPKMKFLVIAGKGAPGSEAFTKALQALYGVAFTIKMGLSRDKISQPEGYFDFKVPPLEGLWWQRGTFTLSNKEAFEWQLMIMVPNFVDDRVVETAKQQATKKHPEIPYGLVRLQEQKEDKSIQVMHIGPYDAEPKTVEKLMSYAKDQAYTIAGRHHEIYMGDPRRTAPERLKTVIRYPVR